MSAARALLAAAIAIALTLTACAPSYRGPPSDHFDGERFFDDKRHVDGLADLVEWRTHARPGYWPEHVDARPGPPPPAVVDEPGRLRVTFVNHATLLIQLDGKNVLTDPIWSDVPSPVPGVGPRRVRPPGVRFDDLPRIDVVLISHNHYDHMDVDTLARLQERFHPLVLVGLGNDAVLASQDVEAKALDWGDTVTDVAGLTITAVPNQHFSNRGVTDRDGTLWTAFVVEGRSAGRVYFAGDTGYGAHFADVGRRFADRGGIRLALLPIGAYRPEWFMGPVHMSPAQAVQAAIDLGARTSVAMHWGTFPLADDGYHDAPRALLTALDHTHPRPAFLLLGFGQGLDVN